MKKFINKSSGSLTIEATISLTTMIFLLAMVFSFINYCRVQALISSAIDLTAKEMSQYAYFYEKSRSTQSTADREQTADLISASNFLFQNLQTNHSSTSFDYSLDLIQTFSTSIQEKALTWTQSQYITNPIAKNLASQYLGDSLDEANRRLKKFGISNGLEDLNFQLSTMFLSNSPQDISLVVYYKVKLIQLLDIPINEVVFCKKARIRAWVGGDKGLQTSNTDIHSIWEYPSLARGKEITEQEKKQFIGGGANISLSKGFDGYNLEKNEFTQILTIDPFCDYYQENTNHIGDQIKKSYLKLRETVSKLTEVKYKSGDEVKSHQLDSKTRIKRIVVIIPEGANMTIVQQQIDKLKKSMNDPYLVIELIHGYGRSPYEK